MLSLVRLFGCVVSTKDVFLMHVFAICIMMDIVKMMDCWNKHFNLLTEDQGGMQEGCRRDAGVIREGCMRDAGGMREGCGSYTEGMHEGCRRDAGGMWELYGRDA